MPCRGSLPAHCHKILQRKRNGHTYIDRMVQNKWKAYLGRNETRGYIFRHESRNMFAKHSSINTKKTSHHPFTLNDFNVPGYVVCYGIHESRFIIWEPEFGLMQYWADEMKTLWIKGIALTLFPTQNFMNSANLHLNGGKYIAGANYGKER